MAEWTVRDHDERGYSNGCSTRSWWSELLRDGKHIAHFPEGEEARHVLNALTAEQANAAEIERLRDVLKDARRSLNTFMASIEAHPDGIEPWFTFEYEDGKRCIARIDTILNKKDAPHECAR